MYPETKELSDLLKPFRTIEPSKAQHQRWELAALSELRPFPIPSKKPWKNLVAHTMVVMIGFLIGWGSHSLLKKEEPKPPVIQEPVIQEKVSYAENSIQDATIEHIFVKCH